MTSTMLNRAEVGTYRRVREYLRSARPDAFGTNRLLLPVIRGVEYDLTQGRLLVDGWEYPASSRRLSSILPASGGADFLPGVAALRAAVAAGRDPVLYDAWRDILPPRRKHSALPDALAEQPAHRAELDFWYADLVAYHHGTLPDGQPYRSTGHYNAQSQTEIFQTLSGRVVMLIAGRREDGSGYLTPQLCEPGDVTIVPAGAWHVTYCLDGPALVFNIYTDEPGTTGDCHTGRAGAKDSSLKYHRRPGPDVTLYRSGRGFRLAGSVAHGRPAPDFNRSDLLARGLPAGGSSLAEHYLFDVALDGLVAADTEAVG